MVLKPPGGRTTNDEERLLPSHDNAETSTAGGAGARPRGAMRLGLLIALVAMVALTLQACMGDDDGGSRTQAGPAETFTPVPPGWSPTANPTLEARRTIVAEEQQTATAFASLPTPTPGPTQPPATVGPNDRVTLPTPPVGDNPIFPPTSTLLTLTSRTTAFAGVGTYNWWEASANSGGKVTAPFIQLDPSFASAVAGEQVRLYFEEGSPTPQSTLIEVFPAEGNVAIPTNEQGIPNKTPAFVRQTDPVITETIEGADPTIALTVNPGEYLVFARVTWPMVEGTEDQGDQMTEYIYRVRVL